MTDTTTRARTLIEAATPLPWVTERGFLYHQTYNVAQVFGANRTSEADAALIVTAVNAYPALLDVAGALERLLAATEQYQPGTVTALEDADELESATEAARAALSKLRESE